MTINYLKFVCIAAVAAITFTSCDSSKSKAVQAEMVDEHTAQNSLDWAGTYSGNLPCADCDAIETELTLTDSLTYVLTTNYLKNEKETASTTLEGKFNWQGNNVKLDGIQKNSRPDRFKVEENQVRQLDMEGNEITGDLASQYVMRKNGNAMVEDKTWQLVELHGKQIKGAADTHYIIFHSKDGRAEAKIDCNVLLNDYKIKNGLQLKIVPGISTLMACPDNLEQEFSEVLFLADNISVNDKTLILNKGRMAPLAVFELVEK